uniref:Carbohydrate ABC transporter permease n=1 Tax=Dictyoglomus turgidum TaxID=513050 RepID=A0A7C3SR32_9BACT
MGYILKVFKIAILSVGILIMLLPFFWMISSSFKPLSEVILIPPTWIPHNPTLGNFIYIFTQMDIFRYLFNSFIVAFISVSSILFTSVLGGYAFAKYNFPGRTVLFYTILSTLMVPFQVRVIPLYMLIFKAKLLDTYFGLALPGLADAFGIFLMRQFMMGIPDDLINAARIDGYSEPAILLRIVLPLSKPAVSTLTIFTFMWNWESFLWPLVVTNSESKYTLPIGLARFAGKYLQRIDLQMAASVVSIIPVLIVFLIFQKHFIEGITLTGMKG